MRRIAAARLISLAGTDASGVALGFALYAQTRSAAWLAGSLLVTVAVGTVVAPLGGRLGDRVDRRRLMIACELCAAAVFAVMAVFHAPAVMLSLSVVASALGSLFGPSASAAIPAIAGERDLSWANAVMQSGGSAGKLAGRLGGGALVAVIGPGAVFALDAVSFLVSAALTTSVRRPFGTRVDGDRAPASRPGGLRFILGDDVLRAVLTSTCIAVFATSFSITAEIPLVFSLHGGALGLGLLTAGWAAGMVAGSQLGGRILHRGNEVTGVLAGRLAMAAGLALTGLAVAMPLAVFSYLAGGLGAGFMGVASQSLQQRVPDHMRAQVAATVDSARNIAFAVGVIFAGSLVGALGAHTTFGLVGAGLVVAAIPLARLVRTLGGLRPLWPDRAELATGG